MSKQFPEKTYINQCMGRINNQSYLDRFHVKYLEYFMLILDLVEINNITCIKEEGCGIGTISKILLTDYKSIFQKDFKFVVSDTNPRIIDMCKENLKSLFVGLNPNRLIFTEDVVWGSKHYPKGEKILVLTHGLLETCTYSDISKILNTYDVNSDIVADLHYISLDNSNTENRTLEDWLRITSPSYYVAKNKCRDLYLVTEKKIMEISKEFVFTYQEN